MDETEQKILDAAMSVLVRRGYEGATARMRAEAAGVNEEALDGFIDIFTKGIVHVEDKKKKIGRINAE